MVIDKPLRVIGIIVCGAMLGVPPMVCFIGASARVMAVMHFISLLFPLTFYVLSNLFIDEGRARERAERERQARERQGPEGGAQ
jgi:hypothetical protein